MPIAMMIDNPEGSQEIYEKMRERLGLQKPAGGILHVAGPSPSGGWRVIEVFETEEDAKRFIKDRFEPAIREIGPPGRPPQPQFWRVENYMK